MVHRGDGVPIQDPEQAFGAEQRGLAEAGAAVRQLLKLEFELGFAGKFHFGAQSEAVILAEVGDAPEVEGFAVAEVAGVASSAA